MGVSCEVELEIQDWGAHNQDWGAHEQVAKGRGMDITAVDT